MPLTFPLMVISISRVGYMLDNPWNPSLHFTAMVSQSMMMVGHTIMENSCFGFHFPTATPIVVLKIVSSLATIQLLLTIPILFMAPIGIIVKLRPLSDACKFVNFLTFCYSEINSLNQGKCIFVFYVSFPLLYNGSIMWLMMLLT